MITACLLFAHNGQLDQHHPCCRGTTANNGNSQLFNKAVSIGRIFLPIFSSWGLLFGLSTLQEKKTRTWRDFSSCWVVPPKVAELSCPSHQNFATSRPPPILHQIASIITHQCTNIEYLSVSMLPTRPPASLAIAWINIHGMRPFYLLVILDFMDSMAGYYYYLVGFHVICDAMR
jgi:hypothetical protein